MEHDDHKMETDSHHLAKMADTDTCAEEAGAQAGAKMVSSSSEVEQADMTRWSEAEFEEKCTYIVKDTSREPGQESDGLTRAEVSLPRNLAFKHPSESKEVRHTHTLMGRHTHRRWILTQRAEQTLHTHSRHTHTADIKPTGSLTHNKHQCRRREAVCKCIHTHTHTSSESGMAHAVWR